MKVNPRSPRVPAVIYAAPCGPSNVEFKSQQAVLKGTRRFSTRWRGGGPNNNTSVGAPENWDQPRRDRSLSSEAPLGCLNSTRFLPLLRKAVLNTITSGPADISMVAVKFAESVVLACVGGRGLAPGASREGDKSVQRDLSPSHPFLLADTLDQAGHALARQMVGWLGNSGGGSGGGGCASGAVGAKGGAGWGLGFGAQHYTVLINALQNLATNRSALFADIVPALATALESVNSGGRADSRGSGPKSPAAPKGLQDAAGSLRSACLRLLKVAPVASKSVQRLATAAALSGSDGEAKAAVDGNSALRGKIKLPARPRERPKTSRSGTQTLCTLIDQGQERVWFVRSCEASGLPLLEQTSPVLSGAQGVLVLHLFTREDARPFCSVLAARAITKRPGVPRIRFLCSRSRRKLTIKPQVF